MNSYRDPILEPGKVDNVNDDISKLEVDSCKVARDCKFRAYLILATSNTIVVAVILMSVASSIISFGGIGISQSTSKYIVGILTIAVAALEGLRSTFNMESRGKTFFDIEMKASTIARKTRALTLANLPQDQIEEKVMALRENLIDCQRSMYDTSISVNTTTQQYAGKMAEKSATKSANVQNTQDVEIAME